MVCWKLMPCLPVHGVTSQDHILNAEYLEKFHTHTSNTYSETNALFHQNFQCHGSVKLNQ